MNIINIYIRTTFRPHRLVLPTHYIIATSYKRDSSIGIDWKGRL